MTGACYPDGVTRGLLLCLLFSGCAASASLPSASLPSAALVAWRGRAEPRGALPTWRAASTAPRTRPWLHRSPLRSARRVDVDLHRAPLADALSLLAEAAGRSLICEPDLGASVSVRLRRVDPLRAMHALAEAHGVEVQVAHGVLIARPAQPLSAASSPE